MSDAPSDSDPVEPLSEEASWLERHEMPVAVALFLVTCASTMWVGLDWAAGTPQDTGAWWDGWTFAAPLMAILLSHEMGHYIAAKRHGVRTSPPLFIPLPLFLGTMGAVIQIRQRIERRNALLDIGASGPLAGMVVALPVLILGLSLSPIEDLADYAGQEMLVEGRGLLYLGALYAVKGPIASGHDVFLGPTAMAGWAGLLVTMINLVPVGQLDGGHVAYALFGPKQNLYSRRVHRLLPFVGIAVSLAYLVPAYLAGERGEELTGEALAGMHWITWSVVLTVLMRFSTVDHPPTGGESLTAIRRAIAVGTLALFALLFMPSWIYQP
ncbi:MAG: site-2 protease family protein [Sandaracinaceae bacterium]